MHDFTLFFWIESNNAIPEDPSCTGKKRTQKQSKAAGVKREFQDLSKNLMESMERQAEARTSEQKRQVQALLLVQERQAKATKDQAVVLQASISKLTDFLGAYIARQPWCVFLFLQILFMYLFFYASCYNKC